jgi:hypothetical protein
LFGQTSIQLPFLKTTCDLAQLAAAQADQNVPLSGLQALTFSFAQINDHDVVFVASLDDRLTNYGAAFSNWVFYENPQKAKADDTHCFV